MAIATENLVPVAPFSTGSIPGGGAQGPNVTPLSPFASGFAWAGNAQSISDSEQRGTVTFTGDGTTTSATLNFINGTSLDGVRYGGNNQSINPFTDVQLDRVGGTAAATISATASAITTTGCTVNFSAAPADGDTVILAVTLRQ